MTRETHGDPELRCHLDRLDQLGRALERFLTILEDDSTSEIELSQAWLGCAAHDGLLSELGEIDMEAGDPAGELATKLTAVQLLHGIVRKTAEREHQRLAGALATLRDFRKKSAFYGEGEGDAGSSCDLSG